MAWAVLVRPTAHIYIFFFLGGGGKTLKVYAVKCEALFYSDVTTKSYRFSQLKFSVQLYHEDGNCNVRRNVG
jgi:hypothetical protein